MNDMILTFHWGYGELPRSQNRTDSRLRALGYMGRPLFTQENPEWERVETTVS